MENKPKTFAELFKGTGIEPQVDKNGNTAYNFSATKNERSNTTINRTTQGK